MLQNDVSSIQALRETWSIGLARPRARQRLQAAVQSVHFISSATVTSLKNRGLHTNSETRSKDHHKSLKYGFAHQFANGTWRDEFNETCNIGQNLQSGMVNRPPLPFACQSHDGKRCLS